MSARRWDAAVRWSVAGVWLVHGLYNKLLGGAPRHLAIVQSVPGLSGAAGADVLMAVGVFEVAIALWILSRRAPRICAAVQTAALLSMNVVELTFARPLLLWPAGLLPINAMFLALAWIAADPDAVHRLRTRLRRHPIPIEATLGDCLTLTYALPAERLRRLLPPGLELETVGPYGFLAVALVQTRALRPAGWPVWAGQDFFLAGYRVFTRFRDTNGRRLRGLYILRSDADRARMVVGGNLLTHYHYRRCRARVRTEDGRLHIAVETSDGRGDLAAIADVADAAGARLPDGSPFSSAREALRFAGPLPFTFDYESETNAIVAIRATRAGWRPRPIAIDVRRIGFFDQPAFRGCEPRLAAAFHVRDIAYRWERGTRYPLDSGKEAPCCAA